MYAEPMKRRGSVSSHRGRWRVRITIDGKQRSAGVYDTRDEAEDVLAALLEQTSTTATPTLREWGKSWLRLRECDGLHRDVANDRSRWRAYVEPQPWFDDPIDSITSKLVKAWVAELVKRGLRQQTIKNALNLLRVALAAAVDAEHLTANPAAGVRVPRMARDDEPWTHLSPTEIGALMRDPQLPQVQRIAITVAIFTGLRAGEQWALRWSDVHLDGERPRLVVRRSYRKPTKGGAVREVPLLPEAREALQEWHRARPAIGDALVFPSDDGAMHTRGYDAQWAATWRARCGVRAEVRWHDLRHTCAASLVSGAWGRAWRLEEVQRFLGHASRTTTERYAHLAPEALHGAAAATPGLKTRAKTQTQADPRNP